MATSSWLTPFLLIADEALDERLILLVSGQGEVVSYKLVGVDFIQRRVGEGAVAGPRVGNGRFRERMASVARTAVCGTSMCFYCLSLEQ